MVKKEKHIKPGYHLTEVGIIPADWEVKMLPEVISFIHGKAHEKHIVEYGKYEVVNSKFISSEGSIKKFSNENFCMAKKDDILTVLSDLPNGKALAKCFYVSLVRKYAVNQRVCIWRSKVDNPHFLYFILNRNKYFLKLNDGVSQTHILNHHIKKCPLVIPTSRLEQFAIAQVLSDTDALISSLDELIAKKKAIKQGAMQEILRPKADWELLNLGLVLKVKHGKDQKGISETNGKYPIFGTGGLMGYTNSFLYKKPSVLIGRKGTIDKPRFIDAPFWTVDTLFYTEIFEGFDPKFIYYIFNLINWYSYNEASGVPSLGAKTIEKIERSFPKFDEQVRISHMLSDMDSEIYDLERKRHKYKSIKQGMMSELLTGNIRLLGMN